jgi:predicted RNA binding protein YcfA (HicA-like mRNA interferase family)
LGKLRILSGLEVCALLKSQGFLEVRRKGSHSITQKRSSETTITVPVPLHSELKRGTMMSIIRQSGIPRKLFEVEG